jgi:hypothetical protein
LQTVKFVQAQVACSQGYASNLHQLCVRWRRLQTVKFDQAQVAGAQGNASNLHQLWVRWRRLQTVKFDQAQVAGAQGNASNLRQLWVAKMFATWATCTKKSPTVFCGGCSKVMVVFISFCNGLSVRQLVRAAGIRSLSR